MITDHAIRDRFIECLNEVVKEITLVQAAKILGTSQSNLSNLKRAGKPTVRALMIANFCKAFNYSPVYILMGQGDKKAKAAPGVLDAIYEELKKSNHIQGEIIKELLNAILQVGPKYLEAKAELIQEAKKRSN